MATKTTKTVLVVKTRKWEQCTNETITTRRETAYLPRSNNKTQPAIGVSQETHSLETTFSYKQNDSSFQCNSTDSRKKVHKEFQISVNQLEAAAINQIREVYYLALEVNSLLLDIINSQTKSKKDTLCNLSLGRQAIERKNTF